MSAPSPASDSMRPPSPDNKTSEQACSLFQREARKHECHYYMRMYGGQVANTIDFGRGAGPSAGTAGAAVGNAKEWWRH